MLIFVFLCFISIIIYALRLGISPMPSSKKAQDAIIRLLPQKDIEGGKIYELGSGWGGLAERLAKEHPKTEVVAVELSPVPYLYSRARQLLFKRANLTILRRDFHDQDLSDAKAVICYLFPNGMRKLSLKLKKELPDRCMVISNTFSLEDWEEDFLFFLDDWGATRIYRYIRSTSRALNMDYE